MHSAPGGTEAVDTGGRRDPVLRPGYNCWRIANAHRIAFLIDSAAYFQALLQALPRARRSIFIIGWDFDSNIVLDPRDSVCRPLKDLLLALVEAQPDLHLHILIWDYSIFYGPSNDRPPLFGETWYDHPRIHFRFDTRHPVGGSHHQKILVVDDALAFVGGIDLTVRRWDISLHTADLSFRCDAMGVPYPPVHDLQMAVDGEAAACVAELTRDRWRLATGEVLRPVRVASDPWPVDLVPALRELPVAVARTLPAVNGEPAVREVEALTYDCLAAARHWIYIETQYFTATVLADLLCAKLQDRTGPEIIVLATERTEGWVERLAMGSNRDRLLRRLKRADRFDRLRVYYPVVPSRDGEASVLIHSKLIVVDGEFLRIGSSNLNNRSMGLDTECDLAVEAVDAASRAAIRGLRDSLLAEHLGCTADGFASALRQRGGMIAAVESLNTSARGLRPFDVRVGEGPEMPLPGTSLLDPDEPIDLQYLWDRARS